MTVGIYALYWVEQGLVYVGQSVEIETRFKTHLWYLSTGSHSNKRVQSAYGRYGKPELHILEQCLAIELNTLEVLWTEEFDSLRNGLNIVSAGDSAAGVTAKNSKYNKASILKVFSLLYKTTLKHFEIVNRLQLPLHLIDDVAAGRVHNWLQEEYPDKYGIMVSNRVLRKHCSKPQKQVAGRVHRPLISPTGEIFTNIDNIMGFCKSQPDLCANFKSATSKIHAVLNETRQSHLGWRLLKE